jgi:hypothetical protein
MVGGVHYRALALWIKATTTANLLGGSPTRAAKAALLSTVVRIRTSALARDPRSVAPSARLTRDR